MSSAPVISRDDKVMRLPHPQRCGVALQGQLPPWEEVLGAYTWSALKNSFSQHDALTPDCLQSLLDDPRNRPIARLTQAAVHSKGSTEMGSAFPTFVHLREVLFPQPHFVIEDSLVEMLERTDISDDIPVSLLKPPYPRCFIEFGKSRTVQEFVPNVATGLHVLEGAYLETGVSGSHGQGVYVMFTGSPIGKSNALDDATDSVFLPLSNGELRISEALTWAHEKSSALTQHLQLNAPLPEHQAYSFSCLKLLAKALLYLGLPEARTSLHPERSEALKQLANKKNPAKRAKAEKQLGGLSDYILVSAPPARIDPSAGAGPGQGLRTHWRRGHYRWQPHGPQNSLRKVIFLQPALIGGSLGEEGAVPKYRVR